MAMGYVVLVLHAHLPYVLSHGKWPHGTDWLCEAACETYIPLLNTLRKLSGEGEICGLHYRNHPRALRDAGISAFCK